MSITGATPEEIMQDLAEQIEDAKPTRPTLRFKTSREIFENRVAHIADEIGKLEQDAGREYPKSHGRQKLITRLVRARDNMINAHHFAQKMQGLGGD